MKNDNNEINLGSELDLDIIFDVEAERDKAAKKTAERSAYIDDDDMRAVVGGLLRDADRDRGRERTYKKSAETYSASKESTSRSEKDRDRDKEIKESGTSSGYDPYGHIDIDTDSDTDTDIDADKDYIDYINQTSKLAARDVERLKQSKERMEKRRAEAVRAEKPIDRSQYEPEYKEAVPDIGKSTLSIILTSDVKYILLSIVCVFLLILMFLVIKQNSTSSQLQTALANNADLSANQDELQSLRIEKDGLNEANKALRRENEELRTMLRLPEDGAIEASGNITGEEPGIIQGNDDNASEGQTTSNSGANSPSASANSQDTAAKPKTHKVVKGDSLWKLAQHYLGDGTRYKEFVVVNNLKNENDITEGQELIIP